MDTGITEYIIGEFGIGLVIAYAIAAWLVRCAALRQRMASLAPQTG